MTIKKYTINPDVIIKEVDEDGALIYNPDTDQVKVLNPTGLFIIHQCDGSHTETTILSRMAESFEQTPEKDKLQTDLSRFLDDMMEAGFIGVLSD
ncbi:MAG: PqqD family peptide modification chaperone [Desulfobacteraceae bacterium]|jgi:methyltransferase-like protein